MKKLFPKQRKPNHEFDDVDRAIGLTKRKLNREVRDRLDKIEFDRKSLELDRMHFDLIQERAAFNEEVEEQQEEDYDEEEETDPVSKALGTIAKVAAPMIEQYVQKKMNNGEPYAKQEADSEVIDHTTESTIEL